MGDSLADKQELLFLNFSQYSDVLASHPDDVRRVYYIKINWKTSPQPFYKIRLAKKWETPNLHPKELIAAVNSGVFYSSFDSMYTAWKRTTL